MPDRAVALAFTARFTDEVLSGAALVLLPTFRRVFALSLVQAGLLTQVLDWVALAVEPPTSGLIDLRSRRWLMALGAAAVSASVLVLGAAPGYGALIAGFALYGLGSGPLANTADVVVVESFPGAPERAYNRATLLDTIGAFLGPAAIALSAAAGVSWRVTLAVLGGCTIVYAIAVARTPFPGPPGASGRGGEGHMLRELVANARAVLHNPVARQSLLVLFCFDVFEAAFVLEYVWLHDSVGLSEPWVAAYAAAEQVVDLVALIVLDRWLVTRDAGRIMRVTAAALVALPVAWVAAPGVGGTLAVGVPLTFAHALIWPLAKSRSLTAVPSLAGATQAIATLFPIVPLALLEACLAAAIGVGPAMALTAAFGGLLMFLAPPSSRSTEPVASLG